jgi:hypothetical protein
VVIGDGLAVASETGFDTDVLHVRDVLRLEPRTSPPTFDASTPAADRVGLLYYDVARGTLRLSVPAAPTAKEDWTSAPIAWVDLALASIGEEVQAEVSGPDARVPELPVGQASWADSMSAARESVLSGASAYTRPKVELIPPADWMDPASQVVTLFLEGFDTESTRMFWRLRPYGHRSLNGTDWQPVPSPELSKIEGLAESAVAVFAADTVSRSGQRPIRGQIIEIMLIDGRTSLAAGGAFAYGGASDTKEVLQ